MGLAGKYRLNKSFIITIWLEILLEFSWKWVLYQQKAIFCWPVHCLKGIYYGNKISNSSPKITGSTNAYLSRWYLDCNWVGRALKAACLGYRSSVKGKGLVVLHKHKNILFHSHLTFSAVHGTSLGKMGVYKYLRKLCHLVGGFFPTFFLSIAI